MHLIQAIVASLAILILVLGFFAFHVLFRRYVWPETYRRKEEEEIQDTLRIKKRLKPSEKE